MMLQVFLADVLGQASGPITSHVGVPGFMHGSALDPVFISQAKELEGKATSQLT